jgi:hypothetical protein
MTGQLLSTCKISGLLAAFIALGLSGCSEQTAMPVIVGPANRDYRTTQRLGQIDPAQEIVYSLSGIKLIGRADWASAELANPQYANPMKTVKRITIHHDGMPSSPMETQDQIRARIVAIRNSHINKNWADIGYHFIVDPLGQVWEGRPMEYQGAHVQGHNENNVAVMVLGNFQHDRPTAKALDTLSRLIRYLMQRYKVETKMVFTHRELKLSGCPGKYLQAEVEKARQKGGFLDL